MPKAITYTITNIQLEVEINLRVNWSFSCSRIITQLHPCNEPTTTKVNLRIALTLKQTKNLQGFNQQCNDNLFGLAFDVATKCTFKKYETWVLQIRPTYVCSSDPPFPIGTYLARVDMAHREQSMLPPPYMVCFTNTTPPLNWWASCHWGTIATILPIFLLFGIQPNHLPHLFTDAHNFL